MTVAYEIGRRTGHKVHHNHVAIELALQSFAYGSPGFSRIVSSVRKLIFREIARSDLPGLVFTYAWAFNLPTEQRYIEEMVSIFTEEGRPSYFLELQATQEARLRRNGSELRLTEKPSKRNLDWSRTNLLQADGKYQLNSNGDFPWPDRHLKIDNSDLEPEEVARIACQHFGLK